MIYIVNCDLAPRPIQSVLRTNKPSHDDFYHELQNSLNWWHYLDKTWLISTNESLRQLDERLRQHLLPEDKLLITKFQGDYAGILVPEAWEWIDQQIEAGNIGTDSTRWTSQA
jgi:hypothetical protein